MAASGGEEEPRVSTSASSPRSFLRSHGYETCPEASEIGATEATNTLRCLQAFGDLVLGLSRRTPSLDPAIPRSLFDVLPAPTLSLQCKVMKRVKGKNVHDGWGFIVCDTQDKIPVSENYARPLLALVGRQQFTAGFDTIPKDTPMPGVQLVCERLRNVCQRLPSNASLTALSWDARRILVREAAITCLGHHDTSHIPRPPKPESQGVLFDVSIIDLDSIATNSIALKAVQNVHIPFMAANHPMLPRMSEVFAIKQPFSWFEEKAHQYTTGAQRETYRFACWVQHALHDMSVMTPVGARNWIRLVQEIAGIENRALTPVLAALCNISEESDNYRLTLSATAQRGLSCGSLPDINVIKDIHTLRRVVEAMVSKWNTKANLKAAWLRACIRADNECTQQQKNEASPPRRCFCLPDQRLTSLHLCDRCGNATRCCDIVNNICPSCVQAEASVGAADEEQE